MMKCMKKKFIAVLSAGLLLNSCTADKEISIHDFTPGTYTGISHKGKNGDIQVEVTFSKHAIEKVKVTENKESPGIALPAIQKIPEEILDAQSLNVDTVAGATITSKAIIDAVKDAMEQAAETN